MVERPPIWMVSANILNKQSRTADEGWSSCLGDCCYEMYTKKAVVVSQDIRSLYDTFIAITTCFKLRVRHEGDI